MVATVGAVLGSFLIGGFVQRYKKYKLTLLILSLFLAALFLVQLIAYIKALDFIPSRHLVLRSHQLLYGIYCHLFHNCESCPCS